MNNRPMSGYESPSITKKAFNCPHCNAYAHQVWKYGYSGSSYRGAALSKVDEMRISFCQKCDWYSVWIGKQLVYPKMATVPRPNNDLPKDVKSDYLEARNIISDSPRGAAALLRLGIEKLAKEMGDKDASLDSNIGQLVKNGLSPSIQKALDTLRVIGNKSVHPGEMDLNDKPETARKLFKLVNIIAQQMITDKKEIDSLFDESLSDNEKEHVEKRDRTAL